MDKSIYDIEKQYCSDVIKYYLNDILLNSKRNDIDTFRSSVKTRLSKVIESRLLQSNLITNYKVDVNIFPLSEKRNHQINNVLTDRYTDTTNRVTVLIQYRNREMVAIETLIVD